MTTASIYRQHATAFGSVAAFVVMNGAERVATIALKYPRDGAGRLYAYVHWIGTPMVRGFAAGGGYDKQSAACASAADKLPATLPTTNYADYGVFLAALAKDDGYDWSRRLRDAGFNVFQAV